MLVLSRGKGESILIGDEIQIQIVDLGRSKVQLGIQAPREIPVLRSELLPTPAEITEDSTMTPTLADATFSAFPGSRQPR